MLSQKPRVCRERFVTVLSQLCYSSARFRNKKAASGYNWQLSISLRLVVATQLSRSQRLSQSG